MALISVNNLTFNYEGSFDNVFKDVSFNIDSSWKLGLIGRNGRGKTTLLKLLMEEYPYTGSITSSVPFMYFPFNISDKSKIGTIIAEEVFPNIEYWKIEKELSLLDADVNILYRPFNTLSGGEQTKLMLAMLFFNDDLFLLIDEPTNNLDQESRKVVSDYLNTKKGFILVSHDRTFLNSTINYTLSINKNSIDVKRGNFDTWQENMNRQEIFEHTQNQRLEREISGLEVAAKQTENWSHKVEATKKGVNKKSGLRPDTGYIGRKAAKMMKRSKVLERRIDGQIEEKKGLLLNVENSDDIAMTPLEFNLEIMANFRNFSVKYNDNVVLKDFNMTLRKGDRYLLKGSNGSGKSSILKLLSGENIPYDGEYYLNNHVKTSYLPQMCGNLTGNIDDFVEKHNIDKTQFMTILRKMGFSRVQFEKSFSDYSEGQKKKVLISKSLCQPAHLFIWDEPLNYIDVHSRIQIENVINKFNPTMIFVEHDLAFQQSVATKIIDLDKF